MSWQHHHNLHLIKWERDQQCNLCPRWRKETYRCHACNYDECIRCFREGESVATADTISTHQHDLYRNLKKNAQCRHCLLQSDDDDSISFHSCRQCDYAECDYCLRTYEHTVIQLIDYGELNFSGCLTLGEGAFGQVRTAILDDQIVAVKVLKPHVTGVLDRFDSEAQLMSIPHQNIVRLIGITDNPPAIITERMFCSLNRYNISQLDNRALMSVCIDIMNALVHLHNNKVVHRDVKPANILVSEDASVAKLADFGLATMVESHLTDYGRQQIYRTQCGTDHYMAPEIWSGHYDEKVDVYAIGVLISEYFAHRYLSPKQQRAVNKARDSDPDRRPYMHELRDICCD